MTDTDEATPVPSLLPELDDLELDQVVEGDQVSFVTQYGGLYGPQGDQLVAGVHEVTAQAYRDAWARIVAWNTAPENRRGNHFSRGGEEFLTVTQYLGLDMTTAGLAPHVPLIWQTQILTRNAPLHLWRYGTRAAAFAGHDSVVERLTTLSGVTKIK